jgi:hypothetical protein
MGSRAPRTSPRRWYVPLILVLPSPFISFDHPHRHIYYIGAAADSGFSAIKCRLRTAFVRAERGRTGRSHRRQSLAVFTAAADVAREMALEDIAPTQGLYEKPQAVDIIGNKHDAPKAGEGGKVISW